VEKTELKRPLAIHRHRWEDNNKMELREVERGHGRDSRRSENRQVVGSCECCNETLALIKYGGISRLAQNLPISQG